MCSHFGENPVMVFLTNELESHVGKEINVNLLLTCGFKFLSTGFDYCFCLLFYVMALIIGRTNLSICRMLTYMLNFSSRSSEPTYSLIIANLKLKIYKVNEERRLDGI